MTDPSDTDPLPYRVRDEFLSQAESAFYRVLSGMVKDHLFICPKVPLQDIFFVMRPNENVHYFNKIYRKNVDFLLLKQPTLTPAFGIELVYPAKAHHRERDKFLDNVFEAAGLPLVHVTVQQAYDIPALATQFREAMQKPKAGNPSDRAADYSPTCPNCGITMVLRVYRTGPNAGQQYYGCLNYPTCRQSLPVPQKA
jgi:hypothetical protein